MTYQSPVPPPAPTPSDTLTRSICVIANPGSGKRDPALFREIERTICTDGRRCDLREAADGGDIAKRAQQAVRDGFDIVAAAGGDGTIAAVAGAIFAEKDRQSHLPHLGIIPLGTFNYVARSLGLPQDDPTEAAQLLLSAPARPLAVGEVNGRVFLNNASLGAYPAILDQREGIYNKWGRSRMAAYWSVLRTLATLRHPLSMKIDVDGRTVRTKSPLAFVANSAYQIEEFDLPGADDVRNGNFALYLAPDTGRFGLIIRALRLAGRVARPGRDMEVLSGRDVTITTRQSKSLIARDGEKERLHTPFRFRLHTDTLTVIAP